MGRNGLGAPGWLRFSDVTGQPPVDSARGKTTCLVCGRDCDSGGERRHDSVKLCCFWQSDWIGDVSGCRKRVCSVDIRRKRLIVDVAEGRVFFLQRSITENISGRDNALETRFDVRTRRIGNGGGGEGDAVMIFLEIMMVLEAPETAA